MRVLKFLINSDYDLLARKLVDYLIDAGHFIYIYHFGTNSSSEEWTKRYKYNLQITNKGLLEPQDYDYLIDLNGSLHNVDDFLKISFNLNLENNNLSIVSLLEKKSKAAVICSRAISLDDISTYNIDYFYNEIGEIFIDTVISLLRNTEENLEFDAKTDTPNLFYNLKNYENSLNKLIDYYQTLENDNKVFLLQHSLISNSSVTEYSNYNLKLGKIRINPRDLEILTLYLLALLNARQEGKYGYDFLFSEVKNSSLRKIPVSKFIEVKLSNSYHDLITKCDSSLYRLAESPFYREEILKNDSHIRPRVMTAFNVDCQNDNYLLGVAYNSQENEIFITYQKDLYFFCGIKEHLNNFFDRLESFRAGDIIFNDLLKLSQGYTRKIVRDWNQTDKEYPQDKSIHQLFEEQVKKTPDNVAVTFEDQQLTYEQLNTRANQLAHYLRGKGIKPDTLVAISCERSLNMIIGILGILKAGGAYVPLDPNYPLERLAYMMEDNKAPVLLTQSSLIDQLPKTEAETMMIDQLDLFKDYPVSNLVCTTQPHHLAYVIYTSGSTGKPKGVMIEHRNVNRLVFSQTYVTIHSSSIIAQAANAVFDAATFEIWGSLLNGSKLVIMPQHVIISTEDFSSFLKKNEINGLFLTTALFNKLIHEEPNIFEYVDFLLFGGELVNPDMVNLALQENPPKKLIHVYGPTESTTFATAYEVKRITTNGNTVPIGTPIANTQAYILDSSLYPVPVGVVGELYIGGDGLARGYLNQPELTEERFIENPFVGKEDQKAGKNLRLYKTGDLCRWLEDGNIEFLGRNDNQVKICGFRIELGEIESALLQHPQVREAAVIVREDIPGNKRLVGYLVFKKKNKSKGQDQEQGVVEPAELRSHLQTILPSYMIPSTFVSLEALPLTANVKVDRQNLPVPEYQGNEKAYVAPRNALEEKLCQVWAEILSLPEDKVGIKDNFFDLGGNSLISIQLINNIRKTLGLNVNIIDVFSYKTIERLYDNVLSENLEKAHKIQEKTEQEYWANTLSDYEANNSPITNLGAKKDTKNYATLKLDTEQTKQLLQECNRVYNTQINDILLTGLGYTLLEVTGSRIHHLIIEGNGREEIDKDIDLTKTLGCFTTIYPVRLEVKEEIGDSLKNIKETLRQVPNKGLGFSYQSKAKALPQISFNYLGQFNSEEKDLWRITVEDNGMAIPEINQNHYLLNIKGMISDGNLKFSIASQLDEKNITEKIARLFKEKLEEIISHCSNKNTPQYTMSDFNDFKPYIVFNEPASIEEDKIFIFPPAQGGAESYLNNIVPKLKENSKELIIFNNYYSYLLEKFGTEPLTSITFESLASDYITYMKTIQAKGSYNLFGWSFGGILAFEIGRQLIKAGDSVPNIILVDALFNFEKAKLAIGGELQGIPNMFYKYFPSSQETSLVFEHTNIVLFKASKAAVNTSDGYPPNQEYLEESNEDLYKICKYYAENTPANHLDDVLGNIPFKVSVMNSDHFSWVNDDLQVEKVCEEFINLKRSDEKKSSIAA